MASDEPSSSLSDREIDDLMGTIRLSKVAVVTKDSFESHVHFRLPERGRKGFLVTYWTSVSRPSPSIASLEMAGNKQILDLLQGTYGGT